MATTNQLFVLVAGVFVATFLVWPLVQRFEHAEWDMAREACQAVVMSNEGLFRQGICDRGPNELAHRGTVDCDQARRVRARGVWGCTLTRRFLNNAVVDVVVALYASWYATIGACALVYLVVVRWWDHRTAVAKHHIDARNQRDTYEAMLDRFSSGTGHMTALPGPSPSNRLSHRPAYGYHHAQALAYH